MEPGLAERLFSALREGSRAVEGSGHNPVLVVSPAVRPWLAKSVRNRVNGLVVLSYSEIPDDQSVKVIHTVSADPKTRTTSQVADMKQTYTVITGHCHGA